MTGTGHLVIAIDADAQDTRTADFAQHKPHDITGPWIGSWRSEQNGHSGELRCIVSVVNKDGYKNGYPEGNDPHKYHVGQTMRFHYHATFMKILSATYDVTHQVVRRVSGFTFTGDQAIFGKGAGTYHYEGYATHNEFHATFRSEGDHGVFEMKRP